MVTLIRSVARELLPPVLLRVLRGGVGKRAAQTRIWFDGAYADWQAALAKSTGYDSAKILQRVDAATSQVVAGNASFERDGVVFDASDPPLPLLAGILRAAAENEGALRVLDFGGSLGSSYRQCRAFLSVLRKVDWRVIEQPAFVARGRQAYETPELRFFTTLQDAVQEGNPDVVFVSGVLQYVARPYDVLDELCALGSPYLILDRTPLTALDEDRLVVQHVPSSIYPASYPCWLLSKARVLGALDANWELLVTFPALDGAFDAQGVRVEFTGTILRRRTGPKAPD